MLEKVKNQYKNILKTQIGVTVQPNLAMRLK